MKKLHLILPLLGLFTFASLNAQERDSVISFDEYEPISTLVVPGEEVTKAKFPFVDIHSHLRGLNEERIKSILAEMDEMNLQTIINLSGGSGESLKRMAETVNRYAPGRIIIFANINFDGIDNPNWTENTVSQLEEDYNNGARGVKIFKNLGLTAEDSQGNRIATDDPRIDPVWAKAGELGIPVLIHTGEPAIFWAPINEKNERLLEMQMFPSRHRGDSTRFPSWEKVMSEQWNVFRKHPNTTFINAHLGWFANDLARLGEHLDEFPNVMTEIAAVIAELGRQPRFAHNFFVKYQDRILFGKDTYRQSEYHTYFRVLESNDEYFDYFRKRHAFWKMYGLGLPDDVLEKVYYKNALKLFPELNASDFTN